MITIRDLLKWTGREFLTKEMFMIDGYALLAERLRTKEEKQFVEGVLGLKDPTILHDEYERICSELESNMYKSSIYVQMNQSFKRMAALTIKAIRNREPVLLVGETGCGKTTLAELLAQVSDRKFYSINCHKHT